MHQLDINLAPKGDDAMTTDLQQLSKALDEDLPEEWLKRRLAQILKEKSQEIAEALERGEIFEDQKSGLKISAA